MAEANEVTLRVKKGYRVRVEEVDDVARGGYNVSDDRDVHILLPQDLKIAVNRVAAGPDRNITTITMCG